MTAGAPPAEPAGRFRQVDERLLHQGHVMRLVQGTFVAPDGSRFRRDIIRHAGAVAVVALVAGPAGDEVVMVRQYRPAMAAELLELPAGTRDRPDEEPLATAGRELAEEAGATAEHLELLASYWVAPGISDERMWLYLATGLTFGQTTADGPEESHMTIERIRLAEAPALIADGRIQDAKSIIGLLLTLRKRGPGN